MTRIRWTGLALLVLLTVVWTTRGAQAQPMPSGAITYERYTPSMCLRASERVAYFGNVVRSNADARAYLFNPGSPRAIIEECIAGRRPENVAPGELVPLADAYARLGLDSLAERAIRRALAVSPSAMDRGAALLEAVRFYTKYYTNWNVAVAPNLTRAKMYLALLDALPDSAALAKARAYQGAVMYAHYELKDFPFVLSAAPRGLAAWRALSYADRHLYIDEPMVLSYYLAYSFAESGNVNAGVAAIDSMSRELSYIHPMRMMMFRSTRDQLLHPPKPQPPKDIIAHQWIGAPYDSGARPIAKGKVTVLIFAPTFGAGSLIVPSITELIRGFPPDKIETLMLVALNGYWHWTPALAPEDEARQVAAYYRDLHHAPWPIGFFRPQITHRPDGRLVVQTSPNFGAYQVGADRLPWVVVIGYDGQTLYTGSWYANTSAVTVRALIQHQMEP